MRRWSELTLRLTYFEAGARFTSHSARAPMSKTKLCEVSFVQTVTWGFGGEKMSGCGIAETRVS